MNVVFNGFFIIERNNLNLTDLRVFQPKHVFRLKKYRNDKLKLKKDFLFFIIFKTKQSFFKIVKTIHLVIGLI